MTTIDDLHRRNQRLTEENLHLRADVCRLTELAASKHNLSVEDLEGMLDATQISADDAQARRLEAERTELQQKVFELTSRLENAALAIEQLTAAGQERGRMLELATQQLQLQKDAAETAATEAATLRDELERKNLNIEEEKQRAERLEQEVLELNEQLRQREHDCDELQTTLEQMASAADAATTKMRQQHDRIKVAEEEQSRLHIRLEELTRESESRGADCERLREANILMSYELDERGTTINSMNERLEQALSAAEVYKARSHKWKDAYHNLTARLSEGNPGCTLVSLT